MVFNEYEFRYEIDARKELLKEISCIGELQIEKVVGNHNRKQIRKILPIIQYFRFEKNCCCS